MNLIQPKRRNKPTLVCTRCKRRKIKCNREFPCSSCINTNVPDECKYENKWQPVAFENKSTKRIKQENNNSHLFTAAPLSTLQPEIYEPKVSGNGNELNVSIKLGKACDNTLSSYGLDYVVPTFNPYYVNPMGPDDDEVNFHDGYTPIHVKDESRRLCYNPLCWASLLKKDPCLNRIWLFIDERPAPLGLVMKGVPNLNEDDIKEISRDKQNSSESEFVSKLLAVDGYEELLPYKKLLKIRPRNGERMVLSEKTLTNTLFNGKIDPEMQLIEKIKSTMPTKKVMWKLIDKFFESLYPYIPFVDKHYFQGDMERIFGEKCYEDKPFERIRIIKRLDLAHVAICLIILRFTYLSLFSNRKCINEQVIHSTGNSPAIQDMKFLILNPINVSLIDIAQQCLDRFEVSRKTNLTVFQATLFMRLYHGHAPEDGDGTDGGDSQVSTAVLIQMGYALGLNREPDKFNDVCNDERVNNLGRKMWHYLVRSDIIHCFHVGNPISINSKHWDVKQPYFTESNKNSDDTEMEKVISITFGWFHERLKIIKNLVEQLLDIHGYCKVNDLTQSLNDAERVCREDFFVLDSISRNDPIAKEYINVINSKIFIAVKGSCMTLYHHIYLHYEEKLRYDIMFFYIKKFYFVLQNDLVPFFFALFYGKLSNHGLIINPYIEMALHKANQFNMAFCVRVTFKVHLMLRNANHLSLMRDDKEYHARFLKFSSLSKILKTITKYLLSLMSNLSDRYFYAWRVAKAQTYLSSIISEPEFYANIPEGTKGIDTFNFDTFQLDDLEILVQHLCKDLESVVHYRDLPDIDTYAACFDHLRKFTPNNGAANATPGHSKVEINATNNIGGAFDLQLPFFSSESLLQESLYPINEEIDQMWLLVMALKYDPLELMSGDFDTIGYFNQPLQSTLGDRFDLNPL